MGMARTLFAWMGRHTRALKWAILTAIALVMLRLAWVI